MNRNHLGIFVLVMLLVGIIAFVSQIQRADAADQPTIWINADGSITPATPLITTTDNVTYTLTGNITGTTGYQTLNIQRDNIVLDGAGYAVTNTVRYGGIYIGRDNVTVRNLKIVDCGDALSLNGHSWLTITNCTIIGCYRGMPGAGAMNFTLTNNVIRVGDIPLWGTISDGFISGNTIQVTGGGGFWIWTDNVTIKDNLISGCDGTGIAVHSASNVSIYNNTLSDNRIGITVGGVTGPTRIYHNRFINNYESHARGQSIATLFWDDGYPSGGNYWSGFISPDLFRGPYQNITGGDGIGDNPYTVPVHGVNDRYPLMLLGVSNVSQTPPMSNVLSTDTVSVNATVRHVYPLEQVVLNCTYTNSSTTWTSIANMTNIEDDVWNGMIQPVPVGTNVSYVIIAQDNIGNSVTSTSQGYTFEYPVVIPEFPTVMVLPILFAMTLLAALVLRRRRPT